jgi:hypothetical protein
MIMTQRALPFQYQSEKNNSGLTGFAGLPLYVELAVQSGLVKYINQTMNTKTRGWTDAEMILSLLLLNLAGGDCISDIERLERDAGLRILLLRIATHGMKRAARRAYEKRWRKSKARALPSNAAIHRYLPQFHSPDEEVNRVQGEAFIPKPNAKIQALIGLNRPLIECIQQHAPVSCATLDQDATLTETYKRNALYCYQSFKAYQPLNTYWAEHGIILHSEFRDGNVNAGYEQLRVLKDAMAQLPLSVTEVYLRSDSAGYQEELLRYCAEGNNPRFGVIQFAVAARVSGGIKSAAKILKSEDWHPIYQEQPDGTTIKTHQEWAEICFVPDWALKSEADYRYLAIREPMKPSKSKQAIADLDLPFQTIQDRDITYKLFAMVTNRRIDGNTLIQWHRKRCGKSEHAHSIQKEGLAGGQFPSNLFGVNAAWWQLMVLAFNLNRLMQVAVLPKALKESRMKLLRFHVIQVPGRVIHHARNIYVCVEEVFATVYDSIRKKIAGISSGFELCISDST